MLLGNTTKQEWIDKIIKDLKGKSIEDCYDIIDKDFGIDPFSTAEDLEVSPYNHLPKDSDSWLISSSLNSNALNNANFLALLNQGVEAISLDLNENLDINELYQNVYPQFIYNSLHNLSEYQLICFLNELKEKEDTQVVSGSIQMNIDPKDLMEFPRLNNFHLYSVKEGNNTSIKESMINLSKEMVSLFDQEIPVQRWTIDLNLNDHTLQNIIKVRTCRMLFLNLSNHFNVVGSNGFINVKAESFLTSKTEDTALITASNLACSAILAGVDKLSLFGSKDLEKARLGINIQHLLKTEAKLDNLVDPLAGAFAIEKACEELGKYIWSKL